ncbi:hypothetical protein DF215_00185 [Pectobacterium versatile]|nr:hypothetical protein BZY99_13440 [Pectobacterium versatile]PWD73380.1 hypothetical protein DF215_00185 [Pectobacterium versatile]
MSESLLYPSYFKLHVRWLRSVTRITYLSKLIGIPSLAAFLKLELFRVYKRYNLFLTNRLRCHYTTRANVVLLPIIFTQLADTNI